MTSLDVRNTLYGSALHGSRSEPASPFGKPGGMSNSFPTSRSRDRNTRREALEGWYESEADV